MSRHGLGGRRSVLVAIEIVTAIAVASALVGLLDRVAPITGLTVLYLPAVLLIAIRRGEVPGLATAVLSVGAMNFFFIEPRYRLTIAEPEHVVALAVFLIAAVVVGRLAASARERARESETRAEVADAREREAVLLAEAASLMLVGGDLQAELQTIAGRLSQVAGGDVRLELNATPSPRPGERSLRVPLSERPCWLYGSEASSREVLDRILDPLAGLLDVGLERRKLGQQAAEAEATARADAAKTAVLHAVSHDLRSPLTAIVTAGSALRSSELSSSDREELLSVLESESLRLSRLVDDLLDLSRIEAGAVDPRPDWCDLGDVVANAAEQVRASHGDPPIAIRLPDDPLLVRADNVQMERVFFNLIENAVKFSPPGAPVAVTAAVAPGGITVRVKDRGRGIAPSKRQHVFEPFFRGRGQDSGSGLGLAICRGFVEANGARIALQTRRGEGAAFAVTFPLAERSAALA
jgi:two-component system sensor histidine kinase KdpD